MAGAPTLDLLGRALDQAGGLIERIRPEQASLPTPCSGWDVRALVNHIVYDVHGFANMLRGQPRGSPDADLIDDDWSGAYRVAAAALLDSWGQRGTAGTLELPIGTFPVAWAIGQHLADVAVHAWDVAHATHQSMADLDSEVAKVALDWAHENLKPQFRGQAFAPEVPVPQTAPIYDRLAAFFGRDPR
jgi:uncharacterized protein (TIGR03086 family)